MKYALWTIVTTYLLWIHFVAIMHLMHMRDKCLSAPCF